jgi:hypothetical protein
MVRCNACNGEEVGRRERERERVRDKERGHIWR